MASSRPERIVPPSPSVEQHKKQAKELLQAHRSGNAAICDRLRAALPRLTSLADDAILSSPFALSDAQFVLAREHGFDSWPKFQKHLDEKAQAFQKARNAFLIAAIPQLDTNHRLGNEQEAQTLLADLPELRDADIYTASASGDAAAVARLLERDVSSAVRKGGPHDWEPLLYVCFSRFLRGQPERTAEFVQTARLLLANGADPNAFFDSNGERETALYGAAGVARSPDLTRLLLEAGADPNDGDAVYHAAEADDPACLKLLVEFGHDLNRDGTALLRKLDFDDIETVRWLLDHGADPNAGVATWGKTALHQAILRRRSSEFMLLLQDHGADSTIRNRDGQTVMDLARQRAYELLATSKNPQVLEMIAASKDPKFRERIAEVQRDPRILNISPDPLNRLIGACLTVDEVTARALVAEYPDLVNSASSSTIGGGAVNHAATQGNTDALRMLLDFGFPIVCPGDNGPTPLHRAALRGHLDTVGLLLERFAPVNNFTDEREIGTPLDWAMAGANVNPNATEKFVAVIDMLEAAGAKVNRSYGTA